MSWSYERRWAVDLGKRHSRYDDAVLYEAVVEPDMLLGYLGERAGTEGWTVVVDPAGLQDIATVEDIRRSADEPNSR
jgi:hypothetical protein